MSRLQPTSVRVRPAAHPAERERTGPDEVTVRALDLVIDANGDLDVWFATGVGALQGRGDAMARFARRAGFVAEQGTEGRDAVVALPSDRAVELCRAFCRRRPSTVMAHLVDQEGRIARGRPAAGGDATAAQARALVRRWTEAL
jgi:hypothetical protein